LRDIILGCKFGTEVKGVIPSLALREGISNGFHFGNWAEFEILHKYGTGPEFLSCEGSWDLQQ
jgi:hypothetical protein